MTDIFPIFEDDDIRKIIYKDEWWFSVVDICKFLTKSKNPDVYWRKLKQKIIKESRQSVINCRRLKFMAPNGKMRKIDCVNLEGVFRIIQSIPSSETEPLKRWLSKIGYEGLQEIEDPELIFLRIKNIYKTKSNSDECVEKKLYGADLKDHTTDLELIFSMLEKASTEEIIRNKDVYGLDANKQATKDGENVAGIARHELEKRTGKSISSSTNYKELSESEIRRKLR